jgi:hypothetical protein
VADLLLFVSLCFGAFVLVAALVDRGAAPPAPPSVRAWRTDPQETAHALIAAARARDLAERAASDARAAYRAVDAWRPSDPVDDEDTGRYRTLSGEARDRVTREIKGRP